MLFDMIHNVHFVRLKCKANFTNGIIIQSTRNVKQALQFKASGVRSTWGKTGCLRRETAVYSSRMCAIKIQELHRDNLPQIKPLWQELNAHHGARTTHFKNHFATFTFEQRIEKLLSKDNLIIYLAQDNEVSIGYCIATAAQDQGEIDSLYIQQSYRGQKIGEQLMTKALDWLNAQGCKEIRIYIAAGNESVLDFYRQFGFAERFVVMQNTTSSGQIPTFPNQ